MSIQKEVEKYQKAKQDLNSKFLAKMAEIRSRLTIRNGLIDETIIDLEDEKDSNSTQISNIDKATSEVK